MLSFDKIRELERKERDSKSLQKVPEDVSEQLREYLHRKQKTNNPVEIENIKGTIKRLYEIREAKIVSAARDFVRAGIRPDNMTSEESSMFGEISGVLKQRRESFFDRLGKPPKDIKNVYKVKQTIPEFVGPDMEKYYLRKDDIVELPDKKIIDLLLDKGVIEPFND